MSEWQLYQRKGLSQMRPYVPGEDLSAVSVSATDDPPSDLGMIARNPDNHADQWYVARAYFDKNLEPASSNDLASRLSSCQLELDHSENTRSAMQSRLEMSDLARNDLSRRLEAADKRAKDYVKAIDSAFNCVSYHNYDEAYKVLRDARLDAINQSLLGVVERREQIAFEGNVADLPKYPTGHNAKGSE